MIELPERSRLMGYTADELRTYGDQRAAEAREQMRKECEIAINPHASYLGDEVIDIIKELP